MDTSICYKNIVRFCCIHKITRLNHVLQNDNIEWKKKAKNYPFFFFFFFKGSPLTVGRWTVGLVDNLEKIWGWLDKILFDYYGLWPIGLLNPTPTLSKKDGERENKRNYQNKNQKKKQEPKRKWRKQNKILHKQWQIKKEHIQNSKMGGVIAINNIKKKKKKIPRYLKTLTDGWATSYGLFC